MKPRIHVITLAVSDLERALEFYRALGLGSSGVIGTEFSGDDTNPSGTAAMFELEGGLTFPCTRAQNWRRTPMSRSDRRRPGSSASARWSRAKRKWTRCSPRRRRLVRPSPMSRTTGRGGSTPATSAISTAICGRSSGIHGAPARAHDLQLFRGAHGTARLVLFGEAEQERVQVRAFLVAEGSEELVLDLFRERP
jgi:hypothetical protein